MQAFAADAFRGKTVRLRAWIRVEKTEAADRAQMWLRVDRPGRQVGLFDNMGDRPITSSDWQSYELAGDVDADAVFVNIGVMSFGKARVWIDDMSFEIPTATPEETAAREEFQKLYAHIDSAYESGNREEITPPWPCRTPRPAADRTGNCCPRLSPESRPASRRGPASVPGPR